jgi:hypothetical protein
MTVHTMTLTVGSSNLLTANRRIHHMQRARATRVLRHAAAINAEPIPRMERAHLTVWVSWPDRRRRDVHNVMPTVKALVDGAVSGPVRPRGSDAWTKGVLPDDDDRHLTGPDLRVTDELSGIPGVVRFRLEWEDRT